MTGRTGAGGDGDGSGSTMECSCCVVEEDDVVEAVVVIVRGVSLSPIAAISTSSVSS